MVCYFAYLVVLTIISYSLRGCKFTHSPLSLVRLKMNMCKKNHPLSVEMLSYPTESVVKTLVLHSQSSFCYFYYLNTLI